jgi:hypothetical protein
VYVLNRNAESYHRAQLVRVVSLLPSVLGEQPSENTEADWESYTSLFPGTKTGADELGLRSYSDAVAAVRRINATVEDLALVLPDKFTLADLSCALCMRGSRQYHKDEGRPFAVRERREGSPPAASRQQPTARTCQKRELAVAGSCQKRPRRSPPEVHGAALAQPRGPPEAPVVVRSGRLAPKSGMRAGMAERTTEREDQVKEQEDEDEELRMQLLLRLGPSGGVGRTGLKPL